MLLLPDSLGISRISYACYDSCGRAGEYLVPQHVLSYQVAGQSLVSDGRQHYAFAPGSFRLIQRHHLLRFHKQPPAGGGAFRTVTVQLGQPLLQALSQEMGYAAEPTSPALPILPLAPHPLLHSYFDSLRPYEQLAQPVSASLQALKVREAALVLLQVQPSLREVLFSFSMPGKLDLAAFMEQHFRFRASLPQLAYLTGRSLAAFKRDFRQLFHESPGRWLQRRRLQEAYWLLTTEGKAPSAVYLEVGFENLSHFSFAFKQAYGRAPSRVRELKPAASDLQTASSPRLNSQSGCQTGGWTGIP